MQKNRIQQNQSIRISEKISVWGKKMLRPSIIEEAKFEARTTFEARPKICLGSTLRPKLGPD